MEAGINLSLDGLKTRTAKRPTYPDCDGRALDRIGCMVACATGLVLAGIETAGRIGRVSKGPRARVYHLKETQRTHDVILGNSGRYHGSGANEETGSDTLDWSEVNVGSAQSRVDEDVADGDEDEECEGVQVRNDIVWNLWERRENIVCDQTGFVTWKLCQRRGTTHGTVGQSGSLGYEVVVDLVVSKPCSGCTIYCQPMFHAAIC